MLAAVLEALDEYVAWLEKERREDDEGAARKGRRRWTEGAEVSSGRVTT